jgi:hypothetical protein
VKAYIETVQGDIDLVLSLLSILISDAAATGVDVMLFTLIGVDTHGWCFGYWDDVHQSFHRYSA